MELLKNNELKYKESVVYLVDKGHSLRGLGLSEAEIIYARQKIEQDKLQLQFNKYDKIVYLSVIDTQKELYKQKEKARRAAQKICQMINAERLEKIQFLPLGMDKQVELAFLEGLMLSNYQFLKYFTESVDKKKNTLQAIEVISQQLSQEDLDRLKAVVDGVYIARDLVNEPYPQLNSENLPQQILQLGQEAGFDVEVLEKTQIESLKMGGLLAVNRGSRFKPTFSILTYKPVEAKNDKPYVLVGKGIVFDSGGMNLKPTGYIEDMKSDMAGAAAVIGTVYAIAKMKLPVYVIGLIPSTDNAISNNSYAPGEVITISNGLTVEIRNTDAEGRLILADALSYAQKYDPGLVVDMATLTGSAMRALGKFASAMFSTAEENINEKLLETGLSTYERLVEFPLWEEYDDMLKSDIADLKNIGGSSAGLITAAKFLEHFTAYPWIHLDIAPVAYLEDNKDYRGKGATGYAVRLLTEFFADLAEKG